MTLGGAGGGHGGLGNRCLGSSHNQAQAAETQRAGVGRCISQPKVSAWAKGHVMMGFGSSRL